MSLSLSPNMNDLRMPLRVHPWDLRRQGHTIIDKAQY